MMTNIDKRGALAVVAVLSALFLGFQLQIDWRQIKNKPMVSSDEYVWSRAPGGSISVGSNTVTLTPCPRGVVAGNQYHYAKLANGVGTAEYVLLTSIAANGTACDVTFTAAGTHSGAWTIGSGTAGIREAVATLASTGGIITIPANTYTACGIDTAGVPVTLRGEGIGATVLACDSTTLPVLTVRGLFVSVSDLTVKHTVSPLSAGADGIVTANASGTDYTHIDRVQAVQNYRGLYLGTANASRVTNSFISFSTLDGIASNTAATNFQWDFDTVFSTYNGQDGWNFTFSASGADLGGPRASRPYTFYNGRNGLRVVAASGTTVNGVTIEGGFFGHDNATEIYFDTRGKQNRITGTSLEFAGYATGNIGYPAAAVTASTAGHCVWIGPNNSGGNGAVQITGITAHGCAYAGIHAEAPTQIVGGSFSATGFAKAAISYQRAAVGILSNDVTVDGIFVSSPGDTYTTAAVVVGGSVTGTQIGKIDLHSTVTTLVDYSGLAPLTITPVTPGILADRYTTGHCTTAASAGATCTATYTLSRALPTAAYTAVCSFTPDAGVPLFGGITAATATQITLKTVAVTAAAASFSSVSCNFTHD